MANPRRLPIYLLLVALPALPGCMIPYAYPTVHCVPPIKLGKDADEVHVFRVDITRTRVDMGVTDTYTLTEVPPSPEGWIFPEARLSATYGCYIFAVALNYPVFTSHSIGLRLYRPGYELIELGSWESPPDLTWKRAPDLAAQERALDRLFLFDSKVKDRASFDRCELAPGSASRAHRASLEFGTLEYERLAKIVPEGPGKDETVHRLLRKARFSGDPVELTQPVRNPSPKSVFNPDGQ
jgi:hypothetical protein